MQDGEGITNSPAKFTCQEIARNSDIYLYVIVSSESANLPADFTTNIEWRYGVCKTINIQNNINNSTVSIKTISGQPITQDMLPEVDELNAGEEYQIYNYYADESMTQLINANNPFYVEGDIYIKLFKPLPASCFTYSNGGYTLADGSGLLEEVIVSDTYNDGTNGEHPVTAIADSAFKNNCNITSVDMSGCTQLTSIGSGAFYDCSSLTNITIPSSVTSMGFEAFTLCTGLISMDLSGCTKLTSIDGYLFRSCINLISVRISDAITSIGNNAFAGCGRLTSIIIPNTVTSIGADAFAYCGSLTSIVVEAGNTVYDGRNNCNALIETATNTLIRGCNTTIIPNTVTSIGSSAFSSCGSLTSITIPSRVTSIGYYAFYGCTSLTSITIPNSVTSIGYNAFDYCSGLTSITIPSSVTSIGSYAFEYCSRLTSITFEDPTTWYKTNNSTNWANKTGGTQTDVSNASTNATYFTKSTSNGGYYNYFWYKL